MKNKIARVFYREGFTLIELMVAISIFSIILVGVLTISVSVLNAYQKAKAIKTVKENAEFAFSSIAKDVRMGKIESPFDVVKSGVKTPHTNDGSTIYGYFAVTRNRNQEVACYHAAGDYLGVTTTGTTRGTITPLVYASCPWDDGTNYKKIVDLTGTGMSFSSKAGFYSCSSTFGTPTNCPALAPIENRRGWVEINLNIDMTAGKEMEADQINVQTIVSSRDYGWAEVN